MALVRFPFPTFLAGLAVGVALLGSARAQEAPPPRLPSAETLRALYAGPVASWPAPQVTGGVIPQEMAPLDIYPRPQAGSLAARRMALGQRLFRDPILSGSGQIACESCHNPELGFGDGLRVAIGHDRRRGTRNAPSIRASAYRRHLFWDGRSASLEEQAALPITNPIEMNGDPAEIERRLNADADYRRLFADVFGGETIRFPQVLTALSAFEHQLERPTRFDRFLAGQRGLLNDQQLLGLHLFRTRAKCMTCHHGPLLADDRFHNLGLSFYGRAREDLGRHLVTGEAADVGAFATPSLRGVSRTGPYMHNGLFPGLTNVVAFYNIGGARPRPRPGQEDDPLFPKTSALLERLELTRAEVAALVAFLEAL